MDNSKKQLIIDKLDKEHPEYLRSDGQHKLNDTWVLWNHPTNSRDWKLSAYKQVATVETVEEFWELYNNLPCLTNSMWFFMRKDITPLWEDPVNQEGGAFKFKVHESKADNMWLTLSLYLVTETMCRDFKDAMLICGITLSPKRHQNPTISVWNLDKTQIDRLTKECFPSNIEGVNFNASMYHEHANRNYG
jgi:hypothetical protein